MSHTHKNERDGPHASASDARRMTPCTCAIACAPVAGWEHDAPCSFGRTRDGAVTDHHGDGAIDAPRWESITTWPWPLRVPHGSRYAVVERQRIRCACGAALYSVSSRPVAWARTLADAVKLYQRQARRYYGAGVLDIAAAPGARPWPVRARPFLLGGDLATVAAPRRRAS